MRNSPTEGQLRILTYQSTDTVMRTRTLILQIVDPQIFLSPTLPYPPPTLHYTTLHYLTLHLHYTTLPSTYTTLHYTTLPSTYTTLHYTTLLYPPPTLHYTTLLYPPPTLHPQALNLSVKVPARQCSVAL
jgi:hypothetical protein